MRWTALALLAMPVALAGQDTLTVRADGPPVWGDGVRLEEEVRIGTLDGEVEYVLGGVSAVAPGPDGSVYVADYHVPAIRRYGSASLMAGRGSKVWGIQGGDFDEAYVVRFGLRGAAVATPPRCPAHR